MISACFYIPFQADFVPLAYSGIVRAIPSVALIEPSTPHLSGYANAKHGFVFDAFLIQMCAFILVSNESHGYDSVFKSLWDPFFVA